MSKFSDRRILVATHRRSEVCKLYLAGSRISSIADELGVTPSTVSKDLSDLRDQWRMEAKVDYETKILDELAKLQRLEERAWQAFEKSFEDCETRTTKAKVRRELVRASKDKKTVSYRMVPFEEVTDVQTKGQSGNPLFLQQVERCITMRLKLMGALDPDVTQNVNVVQINWGDLTKKPTPGVEDKDPLKEALLELRQRTEEPEFDSGQFTPNEPETEPVTIESTAHLIGISEATEDNNGQGIVK